MTPLQLRSLVQWMRNADVRLLELSGRDGALRIVMQGPGTDWRTPAGPRQVLAGASGEFLTTHPLERTPIAVVRSLVSKGGLLGLLRQGALYFPVISQTEGELVRVLCPHGKIVERGAPLFEIRP